MLPRVVADENIPAVRAALAGIAEVQLLPGREIGRAHLLAADALLVRSVTPVDQQLLAGTPVRFVGTATSGYDHIDRDWLGAAGIAFSHAPGSNANSVVEYVLAAIAECGDYLERLLAGERVGIAGYGHIGRALGARLAQLQIDYCVYDPWLGAGEVPHAASLDEILQCSVVSLHTALTREPPYPSHHLLGARELAALGGRQLLINAARGPVVDNAALLARLRASAPPQVVLDVWEGEPRLDTDLLAGIFRGTAHIAGYSYDGKLAATEMLVTAMLQALSLQAPQAALPPRPVLRLASADSGADAIRQLLAQRYRPVEDDHRLRAVCASGEAIAAGFDRLRKQYPQRRELAGSEVQLAPAASAFAPQVRALGARPVAGAAP